MINRFKLVVGLFVILFVLPVYGQSQVNEQGLDYSMESQDSSMWNKRVRIKRHREGVMDNVNSIFTVGVEGALLSHIFNGFRELDYLNLSLGYQRKVLVPSLVVGLTFNSHAFMVRDREPDLNYHAYGSLEHNKFSGDILFSADISAKYFPFIEKRIREETSGNHLFGPFVSISWGNAFSVVRKNYQEYFHEGDLRGLLKHEEEIIESGFKNSALQVSIGYQQRVFKKLLFGANLYFMHWSLRDANYESSARNRYFFIEENLNLSLSYIIKQ